MQTISIPCFGPAGGPLAQTRLISANPFDVTGALNAGLKAAWVNRTGGPADPLGMLPDVIVPTIAALDEALEGQQR